MSYQSDVEEKYRVMDDAVMAFLVKTIVGILAMLACAVPAVAVFAVVAWLNLWAALGVLCFAVWAIKYMVRVTMSIPALWRDIAASNKA